MLTTRPAPLLFNAREIANYIAMQSPDFIDHELVEESFHGAGAHLRWMPLADLTMGPTSGHMQVPERTLQYAQLPPGTRPPIVVEDGLVQDGHHRVRDALARGEHRILSYEVVDECELEAHRQPAEEVECSWWLAPSKVVDGDGVLLSVFHGTSAAFEMFEPNPRGIFFAQDWDKAATFSRIRKGEPRVIRANLRIVRPWVFVRYADDVPYSRQIDQRPEALIAKGYDGAFSREDNVWIVFSPEQICILDADAPRPGELCLERERERSF